MLKAYQLLKKEVRMIMNGELEKKTKTYNNPGRTLRGEY
jgi:hypothetical protein